MEANFQKCDIDMGNFGLCIIVLQSYNYKLNEQNMDNILNKIEIPERTKLANLPAKIEKLERFSKILCGPNIYIKRDNQTGLDKEAINKGANVLITLISNINTNTVYQTLKYWITSFI